MHSPEALRMAVIVATLGRRNEAEDLVRDLDAQIRRPDRVIFSVVSEEDAPSGPLPSGHEILVSPKKGSCAQRNCAIDRAASDADILIFFDDDFVPAPDYLLELERCFISRPDLGGVTGLVIADGVTGPGLSREQTLAEIALYRQNWPEGDDRVRPREGLYGCNMAIRTCVLGANRFDESLPLYGWLEDLALTSKFARSPGLIQFNRLVGVHRGVKRGRTSGVRFGYSQIANPIYLLSSSPAPRAYLFGNIARHLAINIVRSVRPEPWVDRRGRLRGNTMALLDLLRGRLAPSRILDL